MAAAAPKAAVYFSGLDSQRHRVTLDAGAALQIIEDGRAIASWSYVNIRRVPGEPHPLRLSSTDAPELARLEIADPQVADWVIGLCPGQAVRRASGASAGGVAKIIFWSVAAAASIIVMAVYGIPLAADRLAPLVPNVVEKRIGQMVDGQVKAIFGDKLCSAAEGDAALLKLVGNMRAAGNIPGKVEAAVLRTRIPNAVALPGGKVYVFSPLLADARDADELGGVIAHELGHLRNRDGMRAVIQNGGTSFLIGLLFGDVTGSGAAIIVGQMLLNSRYSREAETRADAVAIEILHKLGRSPMPLGLFLQRMTAGHESEALAVLASHPLSKDRLAEMTRDDLPQTGPAMLDSHEWQALKTICD